MQDLLVHLQLLTLTYRAVKDFNSNIALHEISFTLSKTPIPESKKTTECIVELPTEYINTNHPRVP